MRYTAALLFVLLATIAAFAIVTREAEATPKGRYWVAGKGNQAWQWKWWVWLPDKWQRIGACETGYGKRPGNWTHQTLSFEGAFGFRNTSWDGFKPYAHYPHAAYLATPFQQYQTALAIYRRYGLSGWGCRNA